MSKLILMVALSILFLGKPSSASSPINDTALLDGYELVGSGFMRVFFWDVYNAKLFSINKPYDIRVLPQVLKLTYLRDINKKELVEATKDQWQHLGVSTDQQTQWLIELNSLFPNVSKGDSITLILDSSKQSQFYVSTQQGNNRLLGIVEDPDFGFAFLGIWLSENTSRPQLRKQLLGKANE